MKLLIYI